MGKLILLARYWNDMDFLEASLKQVEFWDADKVFISEGAWDNCLPARSTDGTREFLEEYVISKDNWFLLNNIRADDNYRINQANTSNLAMIFADWKPDDWMLIVDVDQFYLKDDIIEIKRMIAEEGNDFDFFTHQINNFFYDLNHYSVSFDTTQSRLPSRLVEGSHWIQTNHLAVKGILYKLSPQMRQRKLTKIQALHYEGLRSMDRLDLRYSVGDRKTFWEYKDGARLKNIKAYSGQHSEFALKVLEDWNE